VLDGGRWVDVVQWLEWSAMLLLMAARREVSMP
jgi:hypothetical protein